MNQQVLEAIIGTAEYYGRQLSEGVLKMYAADLDDLDPQAVCAGYTQYRRNPANRTFPLPAQIRELVNPEEFVSVETQAREIASRIVGAISSCGWNNATAAKVYIGPAGWEAVQRFGGWLRMCEEVGTGPGKLNPLTLQAQLRDQLMGSLQYGSAVVDQAVRLTPGEREQRKGLTSMGEIMKLIPIKPEEPA